MTKKIINIFTLSLLFLALFSGIHQGAYAAEEDKLGTNVALVNGVPLSSSDFDTHLSAYLTRMKRTGKVGGVTNEQIKNRVLDEMINRELIYQESQRLQVSVDEKAIDKQMEQVVASFAGRQEYEQALEKGGISEQALRAQIGKGMLIDKYIEKEFVEKVEISDEETRTYYDQNPQFFKQPEQVRARHILIKMDKGADAAEKEEAGKKIAAIRERLEKGEAFEDLAKEASACPSGKNGGDLGYFGRGKMLKAFEDAAFALQPGEMSDVVETEYGLHIIKSVDKKAEGMVPYDEVKGNLVKFLTKQEVQKNVLARVDELKANAQIVRSIEKSE